MFFTVSALQVLPLVQVLVDTGRTIAERSLCCCFPVLMLLCQGPGNCCCECEYYVLQCWLFWTDILSVRSYRAVTEYTCTGNGGSHNRDTTDWAEWENGHTRTYGWTASGPTAGEHEHFQRPASSVWYRHQHQHQHQHQGRGVQLNLRMDVAWLATLIA